MSESTAKSIVLVAGGLMFAAIGIRRQNISDPFRFAWAAGVITIGLSLLADIAPQVAGPFAILLVMAVYWKNRGVLGSVIPTTSNTPTQGAATRTAGQIGAAFQGASTALPKF